MKRLIVYPHGIGDIVMALPALKALADRNPDDELALCQVHRIFNDNLCIPFIQKYHWISSPWDDFQNYENGMYGVLNEAKAITRKNGYDEIILCGLQMADMNGNRIPVHRSERAALDMGIDPKELNLAEKIEIDSKLYRGGLAEGKKIAVFHGKGGRADKQIDKELYEQIIRELKAREYFVIALETHSGYAWAGNWQGIGQPDVSTANFENFNLMELAGLAKITNLFIGIDSGPLHIMAAMGKLAVGLFLDTWPHQSAPLQEQVKLVLSRKSRIICWPDFVEKNLDRIIFDRGERGDDKLAWESIEMAMKNEPVL